MFRFNSLFYGLPNINLVCGWVTEGIVDDKKDNKNSTLIMSQVPQA
jgi:hypothetical protein